MLLKRTTGQIQIKILTISFFFNIQVSATKISARNHTLEKDVDFALFMEFVNIRLLKVKIYYRNTVTCLDLQFSQVKFFVFLVVQLQCLNRGFISALSAFVINWLVIIIDCHRLSHGLLWF